MKKFAWLGLVLVACGGESMGPCSGPLAGTWANGTETFAFQPSCSGTSPRCSTAFTFENAAAGAGTLKLNITTTDDSFPEAGCPPTIGPVSCDYNLSGGALYIDCGGFWSKLSLTGGSD